MPKKQIMLIKHQAAFLTGCFSTTNRVYTGDAVSQIDNFCHRYELSETEEDVRLHILEPNASSPAITFPLGSSEFGETYHVFFAMLANPQTRVCLARATWRQQVLFHSIFPRSRISYNKNDINASLNETTQLIANDFQKLHKWGNRQLLKRIIGNQYGQYRRNRSPIINAAGSFLRDVLGLSENGRKIAIWIRRRGDYRDLRPEVLRELLERLYAEDKDCEVVFLGDPIGSNDSERINKILVGKRCYWLNGNGREGLRYYERPEFNEIFGLNPILGQLICQWLLQKHFKVNYAIGMMSGAMDGAAFLGTPTIFFGNSTRMTSSNISCLHPVKFNEVDLKDRGVLNKESLDQLTTIMQELGPANIPFGTLRPPTVNESINLSCLAVVALGLLSLHLTVKRSSRTMSETGRNESAHKGHAY